MGDSFTHINLINKGLDAVWERNTIISNNIANSSTSGYKALEINVEKGFEDYLKEQENGIRSSDDSVGFLVTEQTGNEVKENGNNVNVEKEMVTLAKNTIMYNSLVRLASMQFSRMKSVIEDGR